MLETLGIFGKPEKLPIYATSYFAIKSRKGSLSISAEL